MGWLRGRHTPLHTEQQPLRSASVGVSVTIVVLTAGPSKCRDHGKWTAKDDQTTLIHEVLELLVDPRNVPHHYRRVDGHIAEVCDWVGGYRRLDRRTGAWIPDFVYPAFFKRGLRPYDYFGKRKKPIPSGGPSRDTSRA